MKRFSVSLGLVLACLGQSALAQDEDRPDPKEQYVPTQLGADAQSIVAGLNRFGFGLYGVLRTETGNVAVSPASISTAFGLAYAGAKGQTAAEIASTLHYPAGLGDFHGAFGKLLGTMRLGQNGRTLAVNNAIWLQDGLIAQPSYLALVDRHYAAGIQRVDFKSDSEVARGKINHWVEAKTNDRIRNLLTSNDVTPKTRSVLVNTIYFKADWARPFNAKETKDGNFMPISGQPITMPLMNQRSRFFYAEVDGVKALAIPYRGGETEMVLLLPESGRSLATLERALDTTAWDRWLERLSESSEDVIVTLPRFKVETRYELTEALKALGMRVPLSNSSDFSGMKQVNNASPDREDWNLKIDKVVHQVFVEVEEKGTEAAAATAIVDILVTGAKRNPQPPKIFKADHPFMFFIRDRRTNAILFVGRFTG